MRKILILGVLLLAMVVPAGAQTLTQVTGTITDPSNFAYAGARIQVTLNATGTPYLTPCSAPSCYIGTLYTVTADAAGHFAIALYANASILPASSTYTFVVSETGLPAPIGTGPQSFTVTGVTISGSSQSLSSTLSAAAPALSNIVSGTGCTVGATPNILLKSLPPSGGGCTNSSITDNGTNVSTTEPVIAGGLQDSALAAGAGVVCTDASKNLTTTSCSSGAVASVANNDGTLTVSPTTGSVVASLALTHANTWNALQTFGASNASIGTAAHAVLLSENTSAVATAAPTTTVSQCFMSAASNPTTTDPSFQNCPSGGGSPGGTQYAVQYNSGSSTFAGLNSPTTNGQCEVSFNVTSGAAVAPTCPLLGVSVQTPATPYPMQYSDRATYQRLSGGSTFTFNLCQITSNCASSLAFAIGNGNSGNLTLTANAADKINGSGTGGSYTVLPNWFALVYQDQSSAPGNWWPVALPTFSAFGSTCANGVTWSTSTGIGCLGAAPILSGGTAGGDLSGTYPNPSVNQIQGAAIPTSAHVAGTNASKQLVAATRSDIDAISYVAGGGTAQAQTATLAPAITAYAAGLRVAWLPTAANTLTAPTLNVNGLGAKTIVKEPGNAALVANDLTTASIAIGIYDGTNFELQNPQTSASGAGTGSCTNQVVTAVNSGSAPTCTTPSSLYVDSSIVTDAGNTTTTANKVVVSTTTAGKVNVSDFPEVLFIPAANCNNTTAGAGWSIGSGGAVTCRAGTNNLGGYIAITDTSTTFATFQVAIPEDWDTGTNPYVRVQLASTDATNAHTIIPEINVACYKGDGTTTDDVAANGFHSLSTVTLNGNANRFWSTANVQMNSTDVTGCIAGAIMQITIGRATDTATNAEFYGATVTFPRLITVQAN